MQHFSTGDALSLSHLSLSLKAQTHTQTHTHTYKHNVSDANSGVGTVEGTRAKERRGARDVDQ